MSRNTRKRLQKCHIQWFFVFFFFSTFYIFIWNKFKKKKNTKKYIHFRCRRIEPFLTEISGLYQQFLSLIKPFVLNLLIWKGHFGRMRRLRPPFRSIRVPIGSASEHIFYFYTVYNNNIVSRRLSVTGTVFFRTLRA